MLIFIQHEQGEQMSLKAQLVTDSLGNITVHLEGGLDFDTTTPFKDELYSIINDNPASTVTLDLNGLDFVGSSGIGHFVDTLRALDKNKAQIKLANVKSEFLKVFKLYQFDAMELMNQEFDDDETSNLSQKFANRKHTFQS